MTSVVAQSTNQKRAKKRAHEETPDDDRDRRAEEFVSFAVDRLQATIEVIRENKRARMAKVLRHLKKAEEELNAIVTSQPNNYGVTNEDIDSAEYSINQNLDKLFPIDKVQHTIKKRNRNVFPNRSWIQDWAPAAEIEKFATRDKKVIDRYNQQATARRRAVRKLEHAAAIGAPKSVATDDEYKQLEACQKNITDRLKTCFETIPQPVSIRMRLNELPEHFND